MDLFAVPGSEWNSATKAPIITTQDLLVGLNTNWTFVEDQMNGFFLDNSAGYVRKRLTDI